MKPKINLSLLPYAKYIGLSPIDCEQKRTLQDILCKTRKLILSKGCISAQCSYRKVLILCPHLWVESRWLLVSAVVGRRRNRYWFCFDRVVNHHWFRLQRKRRLKRHNSSYISLIRENITYIKIRIRSLDTQYCPQYIILHLSDIPPARGINSQYIVLHI